MNFTLANLGERQRYRLPGYREAMLRESSLIGDGVWVIADDAAKRIAEQFTLKPPTIREMIEHGVAALTDWFCAGMPVVNEKELKQRLKACLHCPGDFFDPNARLGLGKCSHPDCGCTEIKMHLATERCPIGQWK